MYYDGVLAATGLAIVGPDPWVGSAYLGAVPDIGNGGLNGSIDDFRIFSVAASAADVANLFAAGPDGTYAPAAATPPAGPRLFLNTNPNTVTVTKANAAIQVTATLAPTTACRTAPTGSATGAGSVDVSSQLNLGDSFTDIPGGTANWAFNGGTNYNDASGSVAITINQATTITVNSTAVGAQIDSVVQLIADQIVQNPGVTPDPVVFTATADEQVTTFLDAISQITYTPPTPDAPPVQIQLEAQGNTFSGQTVSVPAGIVLTINGAVFVGHSPSLTVTSGEVVVTHSTLTN